MYCRKTSIGFRMLDFKADGNIVVDPGGNVVNVLGVDTDKGKPEKAAIVRVRDPSTITFDPQHDIVDIPGGGKLFTIRYRVRTRSYWALANIITAENYDPNVKANRIRDMLALVESEDLRHRTSEASCLRTCSTSRTSAFTISTGTLKATTSWEWSAPRTRTAWAGPLATMMQTFSTSFHSKM